MVGRERRGQGSNIRSSERSDHILERAEQHTPHLTLIDCPTEDGLGGWIPMQGTEDHARRYGFWRRPWLREGVVCWHAAGNTDGFWPRMFYLSDCLREASYRGAVATVQLAVWLAVIPHRQEHRPNQCVPPCKTLCRLSDSLWIREVTALQLK
jgi:hypothetical protein